ncbi:DEAD/DEAH box helicase family protein [Sphingosinicella terrae]|uniref:DEAD/DEAH box helicase family protein n=1 Tax=Sphingosinicella terrae TaxID=2172047 RepID=UPI0025466382|nr:DEAD/DEAH box helicase family protein [Sphingosinicella terrae]
MIQGAGHSAENLMLRLKPHYRSGQDNLAEDFFAPCLAASRLYRRMSGYFSSAALLTWSEGLLRLGNQSGLEIRLIASPEIPAGDLATLAALNDEVERKRYRAVLVDSVLDDIAKLAAEPGEKSVRARIFAWLIANERLKLKFAFAAHVEGAGLFHEKMGVFNLDSGARLAFTGSANETARGHRRNYESIDVYRDWVPTEVGRVETKVEQFEETWADLAPGLDVLPPSAEVIARLKAVAPVSPPADIGIDVAPVDPRWRHQDEAADAFMQAKSGILEMATGTGKTRTAIKILTRLISENRIDTAIVTTDGTDLLDQWSVELEAWSQESGTGWLILRQYETNRQAAEYLLDPRKALIVVSRSQLARILEPLRADITRRAFIIHDEVHGLGVPALVGTLAGRHSEFGWRLGLSATPERAYDQTGNEFIASELGDTLYRFPLERAIARGVLAEFDYLPLAYDLTSGDRDRLQAIYARKAARLREGRPMTNEEIWTEIAKVYKTAEMKPEVYRNFLDERPETLDRSIIFVETREYGEQVLEIIDEHTNRYRTYYADDDRDHLIAFARGEIACLVTCHRISQGIDIQSLNAVVLFASARARLETVQRIGRCLRSDPARPSKRALVIDFVRPPAPGEFMANADQDRAAWLGQLATTRKGDEDGA